MIKSLYFFILKKVMLVGLEFLFCLFCLFFWCFLCPYANAADFYTEHTEGWHWYQDPVQFIKETEEIKEKEMNPKNVNPSLMHPVQQMKKLHQLLNRALDQAILNPTENNVRNYMLLQNQVTQRASFFTARWKAILLQDPDLDYSILHPTSSLGRQIYLKQYRQQEDQAIRHFAKQQGLFFFYRGDCPYCHRFAPILKEFTERYGIQVIPISVGGGFLPEFPQSRLDQGQAALLHVSVYPSLFAVNPTTQKIIPVAYGLLSEVALRQRILNVATSSKSNAFQTLSVDKPDISKRIFQ